MASDEMTCNQWNATYTYDKETFVCEIITERYIYLRDSHKQIKTTRYGSNRSYLEFYVIHNGFFEKFVDHYFRC